MATRYTTKQVQDQTGIPAATIRRYAKDYKRHMSQHSRAKRNKYFTDKDVAIVGFIRQAYERDMTRAQIHDKLESGNFEVREGSALSLLPEVREGFRLLNERTDQLDADMQETRTGLTTTQNAIKTQSEQINRLRVQLRNAAILIIVLVLVGFLVLYFRP